MDGLTPAQMNDLVLMQRQMHEYLNTLVISGYDDNTVCTAMIIAASERVLLASSATRTAAWLRGHALNIEKHGNELIEAHKAQKP